MHRIALRWQLAPAIYFSVLDTTTASVPGIPGNGRTCFASVWGLLCSHVVNFTPARRVGLCLYVLLRLFFRAEDYWRGYKLFCYAYYSHSVAHESEFRDSKLSASLSSRGPLIIISLHSSHCWLPWHDVPGGCLICPFFFVCRPACVAPP